MDKLTKQNVMHLVAIEGIGLPLFNSCCSVACVLVASVVNKIFSHLFERFFPTCRTAHTSATMTTVKSNTKLGTKSEAFSPPPSLYRWWALGKLPQSFIAKIENASRRMTSTSAEFLCRVKHIATYISIIGLLEPWNSLLLWDPFDAFYL